ncbi:MAG TPA: ABC transporter permease [Acidimicrobiales bacterium]|nr:ABC transporter permease [Acidimicrobiales bacterium]
MTTARLVWHQYRYDQRTFWREPAAVFFTVALPLIFLFIFVSIFGNEPIEAGGREIPGSTYYVPGIVALAIISATTVNLAITITGLRERGTLKRLRSTPLPPWVFMAGRLLTALAVSVLMVVLVTLLGRLVYGVAVPTRTLPGLVLTVVIGTAACCCLGFALTAIIPSENAAPAVTNALVLPLYFFSGIFIPNEDIPRGMQIVGDLFPVKHLFQALLAAFNPLTKGAGIEGVHLLVLAAWGLVGLVVATRTFRWSPAAS